MRVDIEEKVLARLATSNKVTIGVERHPDGKMPVTSKSWDGEKTLMRDQVLEVRNAISDGRLHVARKSKRHDDWDPPIDPYDCYPRAWPVTPTMSSMTDGEVAGNALLCLSGLPQGDESSTTADRNRRCRHITLMAG